MQFKPFTATASNKSRKVFLVIIPANIEDRIGRKFFRRLWLKEICVDPVAYDI